MRASTRAISPSQHFVLQMAAVTLGDLEVSSCARACLPVSLICLTFDDLLGLPHSLRSLRPLCLVADSCSYQFSIEQYHSIFALISKPLIDGG